MKKQIKEIRLNTTQKQTIEQSRIALEKGRITPKDRENILIMASIPATMIKTIMSKVAVNAR